ncbi:unnamed protein product [Lactuca saligna]|uniref:Dof-type domain-containing protein n=1 Tax=Lactuca saligna TaxID=75948 RepID=A0AA35Z107_LACSI|nr:unnamed protein product [Lactuca saligna]
MEDPGIKLFGKKIVLPEFNNSINLPVIFTGGGDNKDGSSDHKCFQGERVTREAPEKDQHKVRSSPNAMAESSNPKTPSIDEEARTAKSDATNSQTKTLKKPDKILPCPRCTSMDTKFCYYNNYNVNQPRHFCKSCQRYWTAGGTMRSMPVGAGRRKNKNSTSHCRYFTISQEAFQAAAPPPQAEVAATSDRTVIASDSVTENGFNSKVSCTPNPMVSWPYSPWNPTIPIPAICPPIPIHPSTYWNSIPFLPPLTPARTLTSHPCEPILGKHSRDDVLIIHNDSEDDLKKPKNLVLIPKTLRIDDPDEAAKSSIWATLGIKNENFKAFQEKGEEKKKHLVNRTSSSFLQANPAAFSRSLCFQETV